MATVAPKTESAAPGPISPTSAFRFTSSDGTSLHGEWFAAANPRAAAVIVHGYAEHCGRYREIAHVLTSAGVAALTYDMRGHGRSDGQRGHIDSFDEYLDDLDAALDELRARVKETYPGRELPLLLLGHSNGALIVLRVLSDPQRAPTGVLAAIVSSPFLGLGMPVPPARKLLARAAARWAPRLSLPNELRAEHLTSDPDKQAERRVDTLCHEVATARWFTETLAAQQYVADYAARIDVPTLWLVADDDRITDAAASRVAHARLRAPSTYHGLGGMQHEVFNERERGRVFDLVRSFLDTTLSGDEAGSRVPEHAANDVP